MFVVSVVLALVIAARVQSLTMFGVMCFITTLASALFGTLTTIVDGRSVAVRFGPIRLIRDRFEVADITSARVVRNSPLHGIGMRYIHHGRLCGTCADWTPWSYSSGTARASASGRGEMFPANSCNQGHDD